MKKRKSKNLFKNIHITWLYTNEKKMEVPTLYYENQHLKTKRKELSIYPTFSYISYNSK